MKTNKNSWSKAELEVYVLLLCANADNKESKEEINFIRTHASKDCFDKIYAEFAGDDEEQSLTKIQNCVATHEYSHKELCEFQTKMKEVFLSDKKYGMMEKNLERILNRLVY